jgi:hypothetical protein
MRCANGYRESPANNMATATGLDPEQVRRQIRSGPSSEQAELNPVGFRALNFEQIK